MSQTLSPDCKPSPHQMLLLNARNTDLLVQLLKASSTGLGMSPGRSCKSTPKSFTRHTISREPLRMKNNDHSRKESPIKTQPEAKDFRQALSQSIDYSLKDNAKTASSSLMNTLDLGNKGGSSSSVVNKYLQRALQRIADKQISKVEGCKENLGCKIGEKELGKETVGFSSEKLKEIKMTNDKLQKMKENLMHQDIKKPSQQVIVEEEIKVDPDNSLTSNTSSFDQRRTMFKNVQMQNLKQKYSSQTSKNKTTALDKSKLYASHCRQRTATFLTNQTTTQSKHQLLDKSQTHQQSKHKVNKSFNATTVKSLNTTRTMIPTVDTSRIKSVKPVTKPTQTKLIKKQPTQENDVKVSSITRQEMSTLQSKLSLVQSKVSKYMKELNFKTIVDLKKQSDPTQSCFLASRCLCQILQAFDNKPLQKPLTDWEDVKAYISVNQYQLMQEIYNIKAKIEKKQYSLQRIKDIYRDTYKKVEVEVSSPRIQNQDYKAMFCFCYFLINQVLLMEQLQTSTVTNKVGEPRKSGLVQQQSRSRTVLQQSSSRCASAIKLKTHENMPLKKQSESQLKGVMQQRPSMCQSNKKSMTQIPSPSKRVSSTARKHIKSNSMSLANSTLNIKDLPRECFDKDDDFQFKLQTLDTNLDQYSSNDSSEHTPEEEEPHEIDIDLPIRIELKELNSTKSDLIEAKPIRMSFQQTQPTVISYDSPNSKIVSPVKKVPGTVQLEGLLNEWQRTCEKEKTDRLSQDKMELIMKLKRDRKHSQERKRGQQLELRTIEIIKELSKTIEM